MQMLRIIVMLLGLIAVVAIAANAQEQIRIDTFDKKSNRTGYIVIDPKSGRLDQFDKRGNRLGYGTTTRPPSTLRDSTDSDGRTIDTTDTRRSR